MPMLTATSCTAGDDRTLPAEPLGVGVEGDRGAVCGTVDHGRRRERAARPAAPDPSRTQAGDCRRPTGRGGHDRRRQTKADELRGRVGEVVRRGVAGRQVAGREPRHVGRQRGRPLRRHGLGVVRQHEHEVVAATERGADLIDRCRPGVGVGDDVGHVRECIGRPYDVVVGVDDDAEERGGEDVVRVARHAHGREQLAGAVAPHTCRGGRVLVQEVDDVGLDLVVDRQLVRPGGRRRSREAVLGRRFGGQEGGELFVAAAHRATCRRAGEGRRRRRPGVAPARGRTRGRRSRRTRR